jgi:hypothetical protein
MLSKGVMSDTKNPSPIPEQQLEQNDIQTPQAQQDIENTMHDKCKNVIIFHNNLSKFFKSLKGVLPEYVENIRECIQYYKSMARSSYLEECEGLLASHIEHISQYDEGIFTDDYHSGPLYLLPKMDFREIWNLLEGEDFQDDADFLTQTKKAIFNHLQTLYVSIQMALSQINIFNKNIEKQKQFLMEMMENLQMDDKIKERVEEMKREEEEAAKTGKKSAFSIGKLAEMFGEDNFVYQLAKDVAEELDMGNDNIENPVEAITQLFANNGKKLQELILTVGDKIEQKVQSGEIDKERLIKDAKAMKDKLEGFMGKIPGLEDMINNSGMVGQFTKLYENLQEDEKQHFGYIPELLETQPEEWSDEEKVRFDEFAKYAMEKNGLSQDIVPEDDIDADVGEPKPKSKSKSKSKSKPKALASKTKAKIHKK